MKTQLECASAKMRDLLDFLSWIFSSRRMAWPMLFVFGITAGALLGLATGLPLTGRVAAGTAPLISIVPERDVLLEQELNEQFATANAIPAERPTSRVILGALPARIDELPATPIELPVMDKERPKIALIIDDMGLDRPAFERINRLNVPVTMAFLPYGEDAQSMIDEMHPVHEAIMHLPMEPLSHKGLAGPDMLKTDRTVEEIQSDLIRNLSKLTGYVGINNHTGSQFTADPVGMSVVLEELDRRGLYFLDSVTTKDRVAKDIAKPHGWDVIERDVFLDGEWPDVSVGSIKDQLSQLERIARVHGLAIGIAHPYPETLDTIGPWLVTAESRGFDLILVSDLFEDPVPQPALLAKLR